MLEHIDGELLTPNNILGQKALLSLRTLHHLGIDTDDQHIIRNVLVKDVIWFDFERPLTDSSREDSMDQIAAHFLEL